MASLRRSGLFRPRDIGGTIRPHVAALPDFTRPNRTSLPRLLRTARVKTAAARALRQPLAFLHTHLGVAIAAVEGSGLLHSGPGVNRHRSAPPNKAFSKVLPAVSSAATLLTG